jgi:hypothetical protein
MSGQEREPGDVRIHVFTTDRSPVDVDRTAVGA